MSEMAKWQFMQLAQAYTNLSVRMFYGITYDTFKNACHTVSMESMESGLVSTHIFKAFVEIIAHCNNKLNNLV